MRARSPCAQNYGDVEARWDTEEGGSYSARASLVLTSRHSSQETAPSKSRPASVPSPARQRASNAALCRVSTEQCSERARWGVS